MADETPNEFTTLTVQLLSAFVSNNTVPADGLADLIKSTRAALATNPVALQVEPEAQVYVPAVSIRRSTASRDFILSLIDGKPYKTLKRHLAQHGLTPDQYRDRFNLPKSYPMVAPAYSNARRAVAEKLGLGRKPTKITKNGKEDALPKDAGSTINPAPPTTVVAAEAADVGTKNVKADRAKTAPKTRKIAAPETTTAKPGKRNQRQSRKQREMVCRLLRQRTTSPPPRSKLTGKIKQFPLGSRLKRSSQRGPGKLRAHRRRPSQRQSRNRRHRP